MNDIFQANEDTYRPPSAAEARLRQRVLAARLQALYQPPANDTAPQDFLEILRQADWR